MDIATITAGMAVVKTGIDALRSVIGLLKDAGSILPDGQKEVVGRALEEADKQIRLGEAQIAQALGYPLCKCAFPPTPMLLIGYWTPAQRDDVEYALAVQLRKAQGGGAITFDVHECPLCKRNDAGDNVFTRNDKSKTLTGISEPEREQAEVSVEPSSPSQWTPARPRSPAAAARPRQPR